MTYLPRLLGQALMGLLVGSLVLACEATKRGADEYAAPSHMSSMAVKRYKSHPVALITDSTTEFKTPQSKLAAGFIREFGDGTVIDKVLVRKAPVAKGEPNNYFLVGLGQKRGNFRAMAVPLVASSDGTYYLSPTAERYLIASVGCPSCYFDFEGGRITGTSCGENSGGSSCELSVEPNNTIFPNEADDQ